MKDRGTGKSRGFGFVEFEIPGIVDFVLEDEHLVQGKTVRFYHNTLE